MNKNKVLIISIFIFVIFGLIGLYFYFQNADTNVTSNNNSSLNSQNTNTIKNNTTSSAASNYYLIVGNYLNAVFDEKNMKWSEVDNEEYSEKFETYVDNVYYGRYYLIYGTVWNLFDDQKNFVKYNGDIIAHSINFNVKVKKYQELKITDNNVLGEVKKYLFKYNYQYADTYFNRVYYIDENNYVVLCSDILDSEKTVGMNYTIGFIKIDGKFFNIFNNEFEAKDKLKYPENKLTGWLVINGKLYLSINQLHTSNRPPTPALYEFDGSKFTQVI